jgi:methyl coenzyme M reductase gamma subunit
LFGLGNFLGDFGGVQQAGLAGRYIVDAGDADLELVIKA